MGPMGVMSSMSPMGTCMLYTILIYKFSILFFLSQMRPMSSIDQSDDSEPIEPV